MFGKLLLVPGQYNLMEGGYLYEKRRDFNRIRRRTEQNRKKQEHDKRLPVKYFNVPELDRRDKWRRVHRNTYASRGEGL